MQSSLILRVFRRLEAKDVRAVLALAQCSHFNRREEVARLCGYIADHLHRAEPKLFDPETVFAAVFPGEGYDNRRLRHTMSFLLEVVRRYLALAELESDENNARFWLLKSLRRRGMEALFEKESELAAQSLRQAEKRDSLWHLDQYRMQQEKLETVSVRERSSRLDLRPLHDHLTAFYLAEMLRHATSALTHQAISAQAYDTHLLDQVFEIVEKGNWAAQSPAIAVHFYTCRTLREPNNHEHFDNWKTALRQFSNYFGDAELRSIYLTGINACIRRMNGGQKQYIREAFDLYRAALDRNLLFENGWMTGFTYKNIIRIGAAIGELEWTQQFFEQYKTKLHPREREALCRYNQAYLYFQQQDYARAMPMLQQTELEDRLNNLDARRMLLRSYFELGEWEVLDSLLTSFGAYLRRQKDLGYHRDMYLNLVRFVKELLEIRALGGKTTDLQRLLAAVAATEPVAEKEWLVEKIEKML